MNYIVVLNWNSAKETIACISSLISLNGYENNKIIICPKASSDINNCLLLASHTPAVIFINKKKPNNINNITEMKFMYVSSV